MKTLTYGLVCLVACIVNTAAASTDSNTVEYGSSRTKHHLNVVTGLLMDQLSILGLSVGYNIADIVRPRIGVGYNGFGPTFSGGVKFMVPDINVTPTLGMDINYVSGRTFDIFGGMNINRVIPTFSAGMEWTSAGGFFLQSGLAMAINTGSDGPAFVPYLGLGASL